MGGAASPYGQQVPPQQQMQPYGAGGAPPPGAVVHDDARVLPRPKLDGDSVTNRLIQGEPGAATAPSPGQFGGGGLVGGADATTNSGKTQHTVACHPQNFVPSSLKHVRLTVNAFPNNTVLRRKYALPIGAVVQPLADAAATEGGLVPVVNFGPAGIVRCRRCRSYINFMCAFTDSGRRWRCSLCQFQNDVPNEYFCPLDASGKRRDAHERPELSRGSVEFVAPAEYMVRPPMPPAYVFLLDVSANAVASGALHIAVSAVRASLDCLPNEGERTKVGIICFDSSVHFYTIKAGEDAEPSCLVVSDVDDMFLPTPEDTLAPFSECRPCLEQLLERIPTMYAAAVDSGVNGAGSSGAAAARNAASARMHGANAFGAALKGASMVLEHNGGKIVTLLSSRPTIGPGVLKDRGDNAVLGTDRERAFLSPADSYYKTTAVELARFQISVDMFICSPAPGPFLDVASLALLAKHTGGELQFFSSFDHARDGQFLYEAICRDLSRETGWEAVMRLRASRGIRCTGFQGRFFLRSTDLMALPNVDEDKAFAVRFTFDETSLNQSHFVLQSALLYTTSRGERRIRVNTVSCPIVSSMSDLMCFVDAPATANIITRTIADAVRERGVKDAQNSSQELLINSLASYRQLCQSQYAGSQFGSTQQMLLPDSMRLLPLLLQGILKGPLVSRDTSGAFGYRLDDKAALLHAIDVASVSRTSVMSYPLVVPVFPLDADPSVGLALDGVTAEADGAEAAARLAVVPVVLPDAVTPSVGSLKSEGVVLIDDGRRLHLWMGSVGASRFASLAPSDASKHGDPLALARDLLDDSPTSALAREPKSDFGRAAAIVRAIRRAQGGYGPPLVVVTQGSPMQARIDALMVEERSAQHMSYREFLGFLSKQVQTRASKA